MESVFHTPKVELVDRTCFETSDQARRDVFVDIATDDDRRRAHSVVGDITLQQANLGSA